MIEYIQIINYNKNWQLTDYYYNVLTDRVYLFNGQSYYILPEYQDNGSWYAWVKDTNRRYRKLFHNKLRKLYSQVD